MFLKKEKEKKNSGRRQLVQNGEFKIMNRLFVYSQSTKVLYFKTCIIAKYAYLMCIKKSFDNCVNAYFIVNDN